MPDGHRPEGSDFFLETNNSDFFLKLRIITFWLN